MARALGPATLTVAVPEQQEIEHDQQARDRRSEDRKLREAHEASSHGCCRPQRQPPHRYRELRTHHSSLREYPRRP